MKFSSIPLISKNTNPTFDIDFPKERKIFYVNMCLNLSTTQVLFVCKKRKRKIWSGTKVSLSAVI